MSTAKIIINNCSVNEFGISHREIGGKNYTEVSGLVPVAEILKFSNDSNVRDVDPKAKSIKGIIKTLTNDASSMEIKNSGVTIIAKDAYIEKGNLIIEIRDIDGIINGGHTQYGIRNAFEKGVDINNARVRLNILAGEGITKEDIVDISVCLNENSSPKTTTLLDTLEITRELKNSIKKEWANKIEWRENSFIDKPSDSYIKCESLYRILNLIDINRYGGYTKPKRTTSVKLGKEKVVRDIASGKADYSYLAPIINDIIELRDEIIASYTRMVNPGGKERIKDINLLTEAKTRQKVASSRIDDFTLPTKKTLFTNEDYVYDVTEGLSDVIIASFRANLKRNEFGEIQWVVPVHKLFRKIEKNIWKVLLWESRPYLEHQAGMERIDLSAATKPKNKVWNSVYDIVLNGVLELDRR